MRAGLAAQRILADTALRRAEQTVEEATERALKQVLVKCRAAAKGQALTAAGAPDPHTFAAIPDWWAQAATAELLPAIRAVLETAASRLVVHGEKLPGSFTLRAHQVEAYMAQVSNRVKGVGDDLWGLARGELSAGFAAGESIDGLSARLTRAFDWDTPTEGARRALADALAERDISEEVYRTVRGQVGVDAGTLAAAKERATSARKAAASARRAVESAGRPYQVRARAIARTEVTGAYNAGQLAAAQTRMAATGEVLMTAWLATFDVRTRLSHATADGQQVPIGTPFSVGGASLLYPGDPTGPADEVVNCRCTTLVVKPDACEECGGLIAAAIDDASWAKARKRLAARRSAAERPRAVPSQAPTPLLGPPSLEEPGCACPVPPAAVEDLPTVDPLSPQGEPGEALPETVYQALTPRRGGFSTSRREQAEAALKSTPEGRRLLRQLDSFQSGGSSAIPRLRTDIETVLRGGSVQEGREETVETILRAIRHSDAGDRTLYRGMSLPGSADDALAAYEEGQSIDISLGSFSSSKQAAEGFAFQGGAGQAVRAKRRTSVIFEWVGPGKKALPIENISRNLSLFSEREWLGAGKYRVAKRFTSSRYINGNYRDVVIVRIEQVTPW